MKFIANYIKQRKVYTTYRNHTSISQFKMAFLKVASFHPHYSTFMLQTYHHLEHRFRPCPTQMTSPTHLHTQARVQQRKTYISTPHNTHIKHNIHHIPYNIFNTPRLNTLSSTKAATQLSIYVSITHNNVSSS